MSTGNIEKIEVIQRVAELHLKGMSDSAISRLVGIHVETVRNYIEEWEEFIAKRAEADPDILDRFLENTLKFNEMFAMIEKEAWDVVEEAKLAGVASHRIQALKLAESVAEKRARLYQLLGPHIEKGYMEDLKKAERVNNMLSEILRDVVADCPRCKDRVMDKIRIAFYGDEEPQSQVEALPSETGD